MSNLEQQRQLIRETLTFLAAARKARRGVEVARDAACQVAQSQLEALQAPFQASIEELELEEAGLAALATDALELFNAGRLAELEAGRECPKLAPPDGVTISYVERIQVPDVDLLAPSFWKTEPDKAKLKEAHKSGNLPEGAQVVRVPSFRVAGDE